ncbi:hypothetical protein N7507_010437 [Penicillium longicatenatum]|nr:hypothetical protein N7507_010437 [Penicillium longicatenatum]
MRMFVRKLIMINESRKASESVDTYSDCYSIRFVTGDGGYFDEVGEKLSRRNVSRFLTGNDKSKVI